MKCAVAVLSSAALACAVNGSLIPEQHRHVFRQGNKVPVHLNSLTSYETQLPYDYYSLPFCKPEDGVRKIDSSFNPGNLMSGQQLYNSPYEVLVNEFEMTKLACTGSPLNEQQAQDFKDKIDGRYRTRLVLDNLPITVYDLPSMHDTPIRPGFELGAKYQGQHIVFNHFVMNVLIKRAPRATDPGPSQPAHKQAAHSSAADADAEGGGRGRPQQEWVIVGFEVMPCSIKRTKGEALEAVNCHPWGDDSNPEPQVVAAGEEILYTYDVYWQETDVEWERRWDWYRGGSWCASWSLLWSLGLLGCVCCAMAACVRRMSTPHASVAAAAPAGAKMAVRPAWTLLAGDVFQAPNTIPGLALYVGTGAQILCASATVLLLTAAGPLSPARRGAFLSIAPAVYLALSAVGGFAAVALLRSAQRGAASTARCVTLCLQTASYFPAFALAGYAVISKLVSATGSSVASPAALVFLVGLWLTVGMPTAVLGGALALRTPLPAWPTGAAKASEEAPPRQRLRLSHRLCAAASYAVCAIVPALTSYVQLFHVMSSVWSGMFFWMHGRLLAASAITALCVAALSISHTCNQLRCGNPRWWWSSFLRGGAPAVPLLIYAAAYRMEMDGVAVAMYSIYMTTAAFAVFLGLGAVGFAASLVFVHTMYSRLAAAEAGSTDAPAETEQLLEGTPDQGDLV